MSVQRTKAHPPADLLTSDQVAEILGVHRSTVSRWGLRGVLPVVKVGGFRWYRKDDVEALLSSAVITTRVYPEELS